MPLPLLRLATPLALLAAVPAGAQVPADSAVHSAPSPDGLNMPQLDFTATPEMAKDYDNYFYFHRTNTSFAEAYSDIRECDALSSGLNTYRGGLNTDRGGGSYAETFTSSYLIPQYGLAGGLGGAIGSALVGAIFGGGNARKEHRISLRNCMGFKGYRRYGLPRALWEKFNFSEADGPKQLEFRERAFRLQALVASGPQPRQGMLAQ